VLVEVHTDAALLAAVPTTLVLATIAPDKLAFTMALVLLKLPNVLLAIWPNQVSMPVHLVVKPVTLVLLRIAPDVNTFALNLVHVELAIVD